MSDKMFQCLAETFVSLFSDLKLSTVFYECDRRCRHFKTDTSFNRSQFYFIHNSF